MVVFAQEACLRAKNQPSGDAVHIIASRWPIRDPSDPVSNYVRTMGQHLVRNVCPESFENWSFVVVRDLALQAFSVAGGVVYVSDGALATVETESELAAVLAHEIGHMLAGHFRKAHDISKGFHLDNFFSVFYQSAYREKKVFQIKDSALCQVWSPEREWEADKQALHILQRSGYDPRALLVLVQRLADEHPSEIASWRISKIKDLLTEFASLPSHNSTDFMRLKTQIREEGSHRNYYKKPEDLR